MKPEIQNRILYQLTATRIFKGIDTALLSETVLKGSDIKQLPKGAPVFRGKQFTRAIVLLVSGECLVTKNKLIISVLTAGSIFGAVTLYNTEEEFATDITAKTDCKLFFITREMLDALMLADIRVAQNYIAYLSERVYFLNAKLDALVSGSGETKLARYICERADENGTVNMTNNMSKLAQELGIARASLYRAFDRLNSAGAISGEGKTIKVKNSEKLKEFCK